MAAWVAYKGFLKRGGCKGILLVTRHKIMDPSHLGLQLQQKVIYEVTNDMYQSPKKKLLVAHQVN